MRNKVKKLKELRARTKGIGLFYCKKSLEESDWDIEEAVVLLQKWGELKVDKRARKETNHGLIYSYVHHNNQVAAMVEVNCESDFAACNQLFRDFCEALAMQVVSASPEYLSVNEIPAAVLAKQTEIFAAQVPEKVPEDRIPNIINGKLSKWFGQVCLVDQQSVIEKKMTIEQLRARLVQQIGENVVIKRFARWEIGDEG